MHILQLKDQNLALAKMAKSSNDNMMTRPELRRCSDISFTLPVYCDSLGTEVPSTVQGQSPGWGSGLGTKMMMIRVTIGRSVVNIAYNFILMFV